MAVPPHNNRMGRKKKSEEVPRSGNPCAWLGCTCPGDFKAPKSKQNIHDYQWLCEEHVREFNKKWNYFEGMNQDEIYAYQKDATHGHRPTWRMDHLGKDIDRQMETAFNKLFGEGKAQPIVNTPPISAKSRDALATLDLEHPCTKERIKAQYRELVKKYHPDVNSGNRAAEDTFKKITLAYQYLIDYYLKA